MLDDAQHINLAKLGIMLKGISFALHWQTVCVYHWVSDTLNGRWRVRTKAASERLIVQRLNTLKEIVKEYELAEDVKLVPPTQNTADQLTRVSERWFNTMKNNRPGPLIGAVHVEQLDTGQIMSIYRSSRHLGVQRTTYFVKRVFPATTKATVKSAIRTWEKCQSIDPAPIHLEMGKLEVNRSWQR